MINPRIFCLLAMSDLDNYRAELLHAYTEGRYSDYLTVLGKVSDVDLRYVRFYTFFFRTELSRLTFLLPNYWSPLSRSELKLWACLHPVELNRLKTVLTGFVDNSQNYAMHFNDRNDYPHLVLLAKHILETLNQL